MNTPPTPLPDQPQKKSNGLAIAGIGCLVVLVIFGIVGVMLVNKAAKFVRANVGDFTSNPERAGVLMALKLNPAIEVLNVDDAKNSVTFKEKSSGKVMTMSFEDIKQGKISFSDDQGHEVNIDGSQLTKDSKLTVKGSDGKEILIKGDGGNQGSFTVKGPDGEMVINTNAQSPAWVPVYPGAKPGQGGMRSEQGGKLTGVSMLETNDEVSKVAAFYDSKLKEAGFKVETTSLSADGKGNAILNGTKADQTVNAVISDESGKTKVMLSYEGPK